MTSFLGGDDDGEMYLTTFDKLEDEMEDHIFAKNHEEFEGSPTVERLLYNLIY